MKIKDMIPVLLVAFILAACAPAVQTAFPTETRPLTPTAILTGTPPPTVTPTPNPTLEPAINFEKGLSQVPIGYLVFIELRGYSTCSEECNCAPAPVRMLYKFTASGELWTDLFDFDKIMSQPIVGFFGYGDWQDQLYGMDTLPFKVPPYDDATVYSVDDKGVAIMETHGETFYIKPGQTWTNSGTEKREPPVGCSISYGSTLTNYGLLPRSKIRFGDPYYH
jgi:hypothetical protein